MKRMNPSAKLPAQVVAANMAELQAAYTPQEAALTPRTQKITSNLGG